MPNPSRNRLEPLPLTVSGGIITPEMVDSDNTQIASLEQQLRIFEGITSTTPDFFYAFDLQGRFLYANRRLLEVWGVKLRDALGKTCRELGYEQWHHDMHMREIAQVIATKQPIKGEVPFKAPLTGIFGVYEYIFTPVIGDDGNVELIAGTTRDVTDRKLTEQALSEREQRYRQLFASMSEGFCIVEKVETPQGAPIDYRFVEANPAVATQSGIDGVLGKTIRDVVPAEADFWIDMYDRVAVTGESIRVERDLVSQARKLELYAYRIRTGERPQVGVIFRDITERVRDIEQLRRNHDTFYNLIQNNPFGVYVIDADFRLRQVSLGAQKVFKSIRPLLGRDFAEVLRIVWDEPFATEAIGRFRHTLETGEPFTAESTIERRHDIAELEAYDWRIERLTLPDGRYGVVCYFYDLSERQRWEAALRQSEERFQIAARATNDVIWDWDLITNNVWWNDGIEKLYGYTPDLKQPGLAWWHECVHPEDRDRVTAGIQAVIDGGHTFWRAEYQFRRADGTFAHVFDRAYVMRNSEGKAVRMLGAMQDLTERKKAESALAQAQRELKQHAENLEQLVADRTAKLRDTIAELETLSYSISHDMRAPLRAMQGFSQALLEDYKGKLDDEGVSYLQRISSASERLDSLIQDILLYTKVARERLVLSPVALEPLIHEILNTYHPDQISKVTIVPPFPSVMGHPAFLSQIISNLVTNALKFVRKGQTPKVLIRSEVDGEFVKLWVEDKGVGIETQHLDRIFQVFGRVYSETDYPGTGIGLAIVKRAVERMGGQVGVESTPGDGSRFWINLRNAQPRQQGNE